MIGGTMKMSIYKSLLVCRNFVAHRVERPGGSFGESTAGGVPVNVIVGGTPSLAYLIVGGPGVKSIADLRTLNIPWESSSVITTVKNAQTKRDMLERVVRAILQAHAFILNPANRARVIELTTTQLALKSQQDAASVYDDLIKFYVFKKPYPTRDGFANVISEVAKQLPKAATLKYEDVVDNSIIEKLDKSGFIDWL